MAVLAPSSEQWEPAGIPATVEALLHDFLDEQQRNAAGLPELAVFTDLLRHMIAAGGKRIRPVLCVTGWQAVSDRSPPPMVWRVAASLELFHIFALIHDDIMDASATRRGKPSAHRLLAAGHPGRDDADTLGVNAAILLGDLALGWSYELLHPDRPGLTGKYLRRTWPLLNALRTETLVGQYLDLVSAGQACAARPDPGAALRVIRYKTAKYTCERRAHTTQHVRPTRQQPSAPGARGVAQDARQKPRTPAHEADPCRGPAASPRSAGRRRPAPAPPSRGHVSAIRVTSVALAAQPRAGRRRPGPLVRLADPGRPQRRRCVAYPGAAGARRDAWTPIAPTFGAVMKRTLAVASCVAVTLLTSLLAGCSGSSTSASGSSASSSSSGGGDEATAAAVASSQPGQPTVATKSAGKLGTILVDAKGRTLYLFVADSKNKSTCTGACAVAWPPLLTTSTAKAGSGTDKKLLGTARARAAPRRSATTATRSTTTSATPSPARPTARASTSSAPCGTS